MDYVLGFDGGGTKTDCVLTDQTGKILARSRSGPSNPSRAGVERAVHEIEEAADLALRQTGSDRGAVAALGAGLAGTGKPEMKERMRSALEQSFPGAAVQVFTDLEIALMAAGKGPVVVLVAGTGSAAIGRDSNGQIWRTGGHGPLYGDEGSAFDIGRSAVARAMKDREQQGSDSVFGKKILEQSGYATWGELQGHASVAADEVFPQVFPVVVAAADAEDPSAREILLRAAGALSSLVAAVAENLGIGHGAVRIAKTGGAMGRSAFFDAQVDAALKRALPQAEIGGLCMSPAEAAARAARH